LKSINQLFNGAILHHLTQQGLILNMNKLFTMTAAIVLMATSAMAGPPGSQPQTDMVRTNGTFSANVSSTAIAGASIQGQGAGRVDVDVAARNWATGSVDFAGGMRSNTAGRGRADGGFTNGDLAVNANTATGGWARADTDDTSAGRNSTTGIQTSATSWGGATVGFDGTFDVRMNPTAR
jgi:hypothetical protein